MNKMILSINEPCNQNWDAMTETAKGRFCSSCSQTVVDFTLMSDAQLINYFTEYQHERTCGRLLHEQLDNILSVPAEPIRKKFGYWKYFVASSLLFFTKGSIKAQVKANHGSHSYVLNANKKADTIIFNAPQTLEPVIMLSKSCFSRKRKQMMMGGITSSLTVTYTRTDTIKSFFVGESIKIFPNPVARGNSFSLSLNLKAAGDYNIEIISASGALLKQEQVDIRTLKSTHQIATDSRWASGLYFVRITDEVHKEIATCKLVLN